MRWVWKRGLRAWPYVIAGLAFLISTGFATHYGMQHGAHASPSAFAAVPASADPSLVISPGRVKRVVSEVIASIHSVGAAFWPLVTLLALLVMLRLGAAIAGIGYDCGRALVWIAMLGATIVQTHGIV